MKVQDAFIQTALLDKMDDGDTFYLRTSRFDLDD
jgi:hypothetical protein